RSRLYRCRHPGPLSRAWPPRPRLLGCRFDPRQVLNPVADGRPQMTRAPGPAWMVSRSKPRPSGDGRHLRQLADLPEQQVESLPRSQHRLRLPPGPPGPPDPRGGFLVIGLKDRIEVDRPPLNVGPFPE